MALVALTDYGFYFDIHMIVFCSKEYRIFHGWMQKTIKNPKGSADFYRDMAMGGVKSPLLRAIDTTFQAYGRVDDLARMGFVVEVRGPHGAAIFDPTSGEFLQQREMAKSLWTTLWTFAGSFIAGFLFLTAGYPGKFARLAYV